MVISAFPQGGTKVRAGKAELSNLDLFVKHRSAMELWKLLHYNFDRAPSFNIISVGEFIPQLRFAIGVLTYFLQKER